MAVKTDEELTKSWGDLRDYAVQSANSDGAQKLTKWDIRKRRTRQMILHAGREVFAERGFDAPKVEDIARTAGISRAAFYLHFKSIDDLLGAIFRREIRWQLRRYRTLTWDILQNRRKLRGWIERFCFSFRQERHYVLILYRGMSVDPANMRTVSHEHDRVIVQLGRRIPQLRLVDDAGERNSFRYAQLYATFRLLEDVSLFTAFNSWSGQSESAIDLVVDQLYALAQDSAGTDQAG